MHIPPQDSAWAGARLGLENARRHRECAEHLSSLGYPGPAVSHLVLATEEAIKSISLLLIAVGLRLPESDVRKLLTNHRARHVLTVVVRVISSFILDELPSIKEKFDDSEAPNPQHLLQLMMEHFSGFPEYLEGPHDDKLVREVEWWQTADHLKQRGLYVDYTEGEWRAPEQISENEYALASEISHAFFEQLETVFVGWIEAPEDLQALFRQWLGPVIHDIESGAGMELTKALFGGNA